MGRKNSSVWKFFKITDNVNKKAMCKICGNEFSFKSTTGNLNSHLRKRHRDVKVRVAEDSDIPNSSTSKNILDLLLWNYFERENYYSETARCNFCEEILSYKTSTADLKTHLRINHVEEYNDYLQDLKPSHEHSLQAEGSVANASSSQEDKDYNTNLSKKFCAEVWGHFELQDSAAKCTICDKTTENTIEDMKSHLEEAHPLALETILNRDTTDSTDAESVQNDETDIFTEVLYLEDKKPRKSSKRERSTSNREGNTSINDTEREISSFLNYIRILLLKVNKKSLSKLQVDIINMIAQQNDDGI